MLNEKEEEKDNTEIEIVSVEREEIEEIKEETISFENLSMEGLIDKHELLLNTSKPYSVSKEIDELKICFYKKLHALNKEGKISEEKEEDQKNNSEKEKKVNKLHPLEIKFKSVNNKYRKLKSEYRKNRETEEIKNLTIKKKIIEEIDELSKQEESIKTTFEKFRELQKKWSDTGNVPLTENNNLWQSYHHHVELFYDYIKINKDLRDLDFKRNLEEKTKICEKAENLLSLNSINKMFDILQELHEHWKSVGPVEREIREEIWERFQKSTKEINKRRNEYFLKKKEMYKRNLIKRNKICSQIIHLSNDKLTSHSNCQSKIKEVQELSEKWKQTSPIYKKDNKSAWNTYRESLNLFNKKKNEFYKGRKDENNINLQLKISIAEKAEKLQNSADWETTSKQFIKLQDDWKNIPFVPNNLSSDVWKKFRKACDTFFNSRKKHYKTLDKEREINLKNKKEFLLKVKKFKISENPKEDIILLKDFSNKWNSMGYVPRNSMKINEQFNNIISSYYQNLKVDKSEKENIQFKIKIDSFNGNGKSIRSEKEYIKNQIDKVNKSILQYENNISFFGNSNGTNVLKMEVEKKIEHSKNEIENLKKKLSLINKI